MYIELPENVKNLKSEPLIPNENPWGRISPFKGGIFLYNLRNELIGQIVQQKRCVRVSVADGESWDITRKSQSDFDFRETEFTAKDISGVLFTKNKSDYSYSFFGDAKSHCFSIYKKQNDAIKPERIADCGEHPFKKGIFCLKTEENPVLMTLFCLAIVYLQA